MKIILSTNGYQIQVDDCYYEYLNQFSWSVATKSHQVMCKSGKLRDQFMHRVVAGLHGLNLSDIIDHKDRNPLNNQISNLRPANKSFNSANQKVKSRKLKGAFLAKSTGKYMAQITVNRKKIYLGTYLTEVEAAKAYDKAAVEHFGEIASLNFPEDY